MIPNYQTQDKDFKLFKGDCMQRLCEIEDNSIDAIFADPPYFLSNGGISVQSGKQVCVDKGDWDKGGTPEHIYEFNRQWLSLCRSKLKDDGTIWISGTHHNIHVVMRCLQELGYKVLNTITWQKSDPPPNLSCKYFNFSTELIIWARKHEKKTHKFNYETMKQLNGGTQMTDVWRIPAVGKWEKNQGKHPTQKPLRLLYRIILACTYEGDTILDPFAGSCTTGIAANLLGRKFIGIDLSKEYLQLGIRRREEINDLQIAEKLLHKMRENPEEVMVLVNHVRKETREQMIEKGICYMRAGESNGSLQITPGFEKMRYVLLHTGGEDAQLYHIKKGKEGSFSIWKKETLEQHGFHPEHAAYYIVIPFDNHSVEFKKTLHLKQRNNTYRAKIRPLSDFVGLK
ncbi:MAG: site-specific DNA-methyltransferase [Bacteroidales bacterium]|nr:site-specific DNA-methyltransferase [Bacteroidales bacterium]